MLSSKRTLFAETLCLGFPALYFDLRTNEIEVKRQTQDLPSNQFINTVKTAGDQCISLLIGIMNSKNDPKEIVKPLII